LNGISKYIFTLMCLIALAGCSHSIQLTPSLDDIRNVDLQRKIDKNVGYYISSSNRKKEVTTPGGGGDDVKYFPYKETESALNTMLLRVFSKAYSIKDLNDSQFYIDKDISYIFKPIIKTSSSSSSAFTWPPTEFTFELTCTAVDPNNQLIWDKTVSATGNAEYDEFKDDFSLSARRATEKAFQKMMVEISKANELQ